MTTCTASELDTAFAEIKQAFSWAQSNLQVPEEKLAAIENRFRNTPQWLAVSERCERVRMWVAVATTKDLDTAVAKYCGNEVENPTVTHELVGIRRHRSTFSALLSWFGVTSSRITIKKQAGQSAAR